MADSELFESNGAWLELARLANQDPSAFFTKRSELLTTFISKSSSDLVPLQRGIDEMRIIRGTPELAMRDLEAWLQDHIMVLQLAVSTLEKLVKPEDAEKL